MKKTAYLWLFLMVFAFVACGGAKSKLIGNWEIVELNGKAFKSKELWGLEFKSDGTFQQLQGKKTVSGKWELDKDGKTINAFPKGKPAEKMEIVKIEADKLNLKDAENNIVFKKRK